MRSTIMLVDDIPVNMMILESILEDEYNVVMANRGDLALSLMAGEARPDLVLLDIAMPEMDGFEVLARMHEDNELAGIPVIFVTGEVDVYSEERGLKMGAVDYIKKPYVPEIIFVKIRNHLENKKLRDNLENAVAERTKELIAAHEAVIPGMSLLSESRDKVTGAHILRIKMLTQILTDRILEQRPDLLDPVTAEMIKTYAPLHDVGKVSVPDAVLKKEGVLTSDEFEQIKEHATGGGELLRQIADFLPSEKQYLNVAIDIAVHHHERFDGTGYPHGLKRNEIPIAARIVSVVDVYDALRSPRQYKPSFTHGESMEIIIKGDKKTRPEHFDPIVLKAFIELQEEMRKAYDSNPDPHM